MPAFSAGDCNGYYRADDESWGRGSRPAINVNRHDARSYCSWLTRRTGKEYRLLSEAEWEYAARAGTRTRYSWGDDIGRNRANCDGLRQPLGTMRKTAPVGSFFANSFGLFDMHGNVWEWVEDCWHDSYVGAPLDESAWTTGGNCDLRVLRGGFLAQGCVGAPFQQAATGFNFRCSQLQHRVSSCPDTRPLNLYLLVSGVWRRSSQPEFSWISAAEAWKNAVMDGDSVRSIFELLPLAAAASHGPAGKQVCRTSGPPKTWAHRPHTMEASSIPAGAVTAHPADMNVPWRRCRSI